MEIMNDIEILKLYKQGVTHKNFDEFRGAYRQITGKPYNGSCAPCSNKVIMGVVRRYLQSKQLIELNK